MEWTWLESVPSNRKRVFDELVQGREMASQLQRSISGDVRSAEGLVTKILGSFTNTLRFLNGSTTQEDHVSHVQADSPTSTVTAAASGSASGSAAAAGSSSWGGLDDAVKSEESNEESYKSAETFKDRRGSYKRRKSSLSWTKDSLELVDDGHAWRKYGQKTILNNKYPRNYFRCTHKFDQGCQATKHVQKIKDEPQLYRTTYYGSHICTDYLRAPEFILDGSTSQESSKNIIRFDSAVDGDIACKQEHPFFSFASIKKESIVKEVEMIAPIGDHHHDHAHHNQSASSWDDLMSPPGLGVFDSCYDHDDVFSRIMVGGYLGNEPDFPFEF